MIVFVGVDGNECVVMRPDLIAVVAEGMEQYHYPDGITAKPGQFRRLTFAFGGYIDVCETREQVIQKIEDALATHKSKEAGQ